MPVRRYTPAQLISLRESPLVKKPDDLPPIEQWIEYVYLDKDSREKLRIPHSESAGQPQQKENNNNARSRVARPPNANGEASPMGNFSTGQRPSLMQTRSHVSKTGEDVVLGPPKTAFASSSRLARTAGNGDNGGDADEADNGRTKTFGQQNRKSANLDEKEGRDNRVSWTEARERRLLEQRDEQKDGNDRFNNRHNNRRDRDQDAERRNGDNQDSRWSRRDEKRQNGERQGGWRERENNRQRQGWDRGDHAEKDPEWFDEPVALQKQEEDLGMGTARTQEDFQKWKEMMKGNIVPPEQATAVEPTPLAKENPPKSVAQLKLENFGEPTGFGGFGMKSPDIPATETAQTPAKSTAPKGKSSRFASMFKKEDAPVPAPAPAMEETPVQLFANAAAESASDDKEGFQRILKMLGKADISSPKPEQPMFNEPTSPQRPSNGTRQKSRFFDSAPKSPERFQSPQAGLQQLFGNGGNGFAPENRGLTNEPSGMFGIGMPETLQQNQPKRQQPPSSMISPEPMPQQSTNRDSLPPQARQSEMAMNEPPSRNAATPDVNIQNLLAAQRNRGAAASNKDSEFLLGLLQGQNSRPASQQARPDRDFPLWLGQPPEPHAPKPRAPPPPGLIDDHLLRNGPHDIHRQEQQPIPGPDMPTRRTSQRVPQPPPGFDEHAMFLQQQQMQQRRNFTEPPHQQQPPPNRRMSGHPGLPGMPPQQQPPFPPDFPYIQSPPVHQQGPPPGFSNMRHPQGFANIPSIFQAAQPQQQREPPPGFGGGMMPNAMSPPGPPPGFGAGPPPGMPPGLMGMRSPAEGIPAGNGFRGAGRGFEGYDGMGQRR